MDGVPLATGPAASVTAADATPSALLVQAAAGSEPARETLGAHYRRMAFLLALQLTGDREDARDLAQDAMVRFFANLQSLRAGRDPRPWLLAVVRNLARDRWRRRRVRPTDSIDDAAAVFELPASDADPEQILQRRERQERLWRALAVLPLEKREILVLRDFHDLSYAEIAGVLDIPAGTVMSRLHAARSALRAAFIEAGHG